MWSIYTDLTTSFAEVVQVVNALRKIEENDLIDGTDSTKPISLRDLTAQSGPGLY